MISGEYLSKCPRGKFPKLQRIFNKKISPYLLLSLLFIGLVVPLITKSELNTYDARDEKSYHYPTVLALLEQFPNFDLVNFSSATTPLYHIVLALPSLIFGSDIVLLRLLNSMISLCCLLASYGYLSKRGTKLKAFYFSIFLLLSPYFMGPAVRLSTDNMALLFLLLSISAMDVGLPNLLNFLRVNILILCTILTRQIYTWLIGVYLLFYLLRKDKLKLQYIAQVVLPTLLPMVGLAYFLFIWGGLTSPIFSARHTSLGINWDVPVFIVSLVGLYGVFFGLWLFIIFKKNQVQPFHLALLSGCAIAYLLLHPVSNQYPVIDPSLGDRGGALWLIASHLPNFLSSSIVFWILFPMGLSCLFMMVRYLASRREYLLILCFILWLIANMSNIRTYQKYYEPFLVFWMGYVLVSVKTEGEKYAWVGPVVLIVGFAGIAITRYFI
jgi:hypothetical protein